MKTKSLIFVCKVVPDYNRIEDFFYSRKIIVDYNIVG